MLLSPYSLQWLFLLHMLADAAPAAQPHSLHCSFYRDHFSSGALNARGRTTRASAQHLLENLAAPSFTAIDGHHQSQREISYPWEENLAATVVEQSSH